MVPDNLKSGVNKASFYDPEINLSYGRMTDDQRRDLLEIIDDRHEMRSVIITSQVPIGQWYEIIGNPTIADAILDRLVHNAYRIELTGESLRKKKNPPLTNTPT